MFNHDEILETHERIKKDVAALKREEEEKRRITERLMEIDKEWNKEVKKLARNNKNFKKLIDLYPKMHQPDRRKRCEELIDRKKKEMDENQRKIRQLAQERKNILSRIITDKPYS